MFEFKIKSTDGLARSGNFTTAHGSFNTPVFMPVGTKATVKGLLNEEIDEMGAEIILNNTYHLYLRPGKDVVKHFGGAHKFQNYHKPILTDSGGFQVFSLGQTRDGKSLAKITEDGVHFKSFIDGSSHFFNSENVMDTQSALGSDIIMAFDECAAGDSSHSYARAAMERTHRWAIRSVNQWKKNEIKRSNAGIYPQALFPIIQGVTYDDLRVESTKFISKLDCPGIAIGGLSVGETKEDMYRILDTINPHLPKNKPRYLMGVGTPEDLIEAIDRGIDMFDCVLPTRLGRHATAFTSTGKVNIKNVKWKFSNESLDENCDCKVCNSYSKGYLRHLLKEDESVGAKLLSYHNLYILIDICKKSREAIINNKFQEFKKDFRSKYKF